MIFHSGQDVFHDDPQNLRPSLTMFQGFESSLKCGMSSCPARKRSLALRLKRLCQRRLSSFSLSERVIAITGVFRQLLLISPPTPARPYPRTCRRSPNEQGTPTCILPALRANNGENVQNTSAWDDIFQKRDPVSHGLAQRTTPCSRNTHPSPILNQRKREPYAR